MPLSNDLVQVPHVLGGVGRDLFPDEEEMLAIRWHMGGFDDTARSYAGGQSLSGAMKRYSLVPALHMADMATCYFAGK